MYWWSTAYRDVAVLIVISPHSVRSRSLTGSRGFIEGFYIAVINATASARFTEDVHVLCFCSWKFGEQMMRPARASQTSTMIKNDTKKHTISNLITFEESSVFLSSSPGRFFHLAHKKRRSLLIISSFFKFFHVEKLGFFFCVLHLQA